MHTVPLADEITQNRARLQRLARRLVQNQMGAEDLVQETVLRALAHTDQLPPKTQLFAWLTSILRDSYDRERRWKHCVQALESLMTTSGPSTHGEQEKGSHGLPRFGATILHAPDFAHLDKAA